MLILVLIVILILWGKRGMSITMRMRTMSRPFFQTDSKEKTGAPDRWAVC